MSKDDLNQVYRDVVRRFGFGGEALVKLWADAGVKVRTSGQSEKPMTLYHALRFIRTIDHDDYLVLGSNKLKRFLVSVIKSKGGEIEGMSLPLLIAQVEKLS